MTYDEPGRLKRLQALRLLDTPPESRFDSLTARALALFPGSLAAALSLVDASRVWFKSRKGLDQSELPRDVAFCSHAIQDSRVMVVPDLTLDRRFAANELVSGKAGFRFYAGAPLTGSVGTLCVLGTEVSHPSAAQVDGLARLAMLADTQLMMHDILCDLARTRPT